MSMPVKLRAQLGMLDLSPEKIDIVAVSHLHLDHLGNLPDLISSRILVRKEEWTELHREGVEWGVGYSTEQINLLETAPDLELVEGEFDVFGDGSVRLIHAPGHTKGSQILFVSLQNHGNIIISGDTVHFREELEHHVVPSMNDSVEQTRESITMILDLAEANAAEFWIQHDPVQHQARMLAPDYYD